MGRSATWTQIWSEFKAGTPGSRFSEQHRRRGKAHSARARMAFIIAGTILIATGLLLVFTPGPGLVLAALGAAVLARESAVAARAFDHLELRLRRLAARLRRAI